MTPHGCRVWVVFLSSFTDIVSSAKFVLIVEKDATFQRLLDDDFCTKMSPCIIITVRQSPRHSDPSQLLLKEALLDAGAALAWIRVKACQT